MATHPKLVGRHAQALQLLRLDGGAVHAVLPVQELHDAAARAPDRPIIPAQRAAPLWPRMQQPAHSTSGCTVAATHHCVHVCRRKTFAHRLLSSKLQQLFFGDCSETYLSRWASRQPGSNKSLSPRT